VIVAKAEVVVAVEREVVEFGKEGAECAITKKRARTNIFQGPL
jgi:hypothetical protein